METWLGSEIDSRIVKALNVAYPGFDGQKIFEEYHHDDVMLVRMGIIMLIYDPPAPRDSVKEKADG